MISRQKKKTKIFFAKSVKSFYLCDPILKNHLDKKFIDVLTVVR
jgi:hypothetical protein